MGGCCSRMRGWVNWKDRGIPNGTGQRECGSACFQADQHRSQADSGFSPFPPRLPPVVPTFSKHPKTLMGLDQHKPSNRESSAGSVGEWIHASSPDGHAKQSIGGHHFRLVWGSASFVRSSSGSSMPSATSGTSAPKSQRSATPTITGRDTHARRSGQIHGDKT